MDGDGNHKDYPYAVYFNINKESLEHNKDIDLEILENQIKKLKPIGPRKISETWCGFIVLCLNEKDADKLIQAHLENLFISSVQVVKFSTRDNPKKQSQPHKFMFSKVLNPDLDYLAFFRHRSRVNLLEIEKYVVLLRDIPGVIPLQEIKVCLEKQGIMSAKIERIRQHVKVEVADGLEYEKLLRNGLDFFGAIRFPAVPERWKTEYLQDTVVQCYNCQDFWHMAGQCRRGARCVRCGGAHSVDSCTWPRDQPSCCLCGGPHHAAYRWCPYRLQLSYKPYHSYTAQY